MKTKIYNEHELDETVNLWAGYTYVINGKPTILVLPDGRKKITVEEYKAANLAAVKYDPALMNSGAMTAPMPPSSIKSVMNCDMAGRGLPLKR